MSVDPIINWHQFLLRSSLGHVHFHSIAEIFASIRARFIKLLLSDLGIPNSTPVFASGKGGKSFSGIWDFLEKWLGICVDWDLGGLKMV